MQASPSSHGSELAENTQPTPVWHSSSVQGLASLQPMSARRFAQPLAESQVSTVHGSASSQLTTWPLHWPPAQVSASVQRSASSHAAVLAMCVHPTPSRHASSVHGLSSSQAMGGPAAHTPTRHVSWKVHSCPRSQGSPSATGLLGHSPVAGSHVTTTHAASGPLAGVHTTAVSGSSSQCGQGWASVVTHLRTPVHRLAGGAQSESITQPQAPVSTYRQPTAGAQVSAVHGSASSHTTALPAQSPEASHASSPVHASPSSQGAPAAGVYTHPSAPAQVSVVHGSPSSHPSSSRAPSQSLSTPSHTSGAGSRASHSLSPSGPQTRRPAQTPYSVSRSHAAESAAAVAPTEQPHPDGLWQNPSWHSYPPGHGAASEQAVAQNAPSAPWETQATACSASAPAHPASSTHGRHRVG